MLKPDAVDNRALEQKVAFRIAQQAVNLFATMEA